MVEIASELGPVLKNMPFLGVYSCEDELHLYVHCLNFVVYALK